MEFIIEKTFRNVALPEDAWWKTEKIFAQIEKDYTQLSGYDKFEKDIFHEGPIHADMNLGNQLPAFNFLIYLARGRLFGGAVFQIFYKLI